MVGRAGFLRQRKVALDLRILARRADARQSVRAREFPVVYAAAADERVVLAVGGEDAAGGATASPFRPTVMLP